ncbi:MAG: NifU N-terminal domain-containing protein [Acidimicrobiia bacterium]|nr:NifU N-terminal domain-containing protein [Acidimicrobiia bacterium]
MAVEIHQTPNPNALKFAVGVDVGGPHTFVAGGDDLPAPADALLELPGVASVFMTADFVTLSKMPDASWDDIAEAARGVLAAHFGA